MNSFHFVLHLIISVFDEKMLLHCLFGDYTLMIPWSLLFQETLDFVSYVAKDLVNGRACHVLECGGGLSEDVITTIGQAFELRFKEYLKNQPKAMEIPDR